MTQEIELDFPWEDSDLITGVTVKFWAVYDRSTHSFSPVKIRVTALKLHLLFGAWNAGVFQNRTADVTVPVDNGWVNPADMKAIEQWAEGWFWTEGQAKMLARQEHRDAALTDGDTLADQARDRTR